MHWAIATFFYGLVLSRFLCDHLYFLEGKEVPNKADNTAYFTNKTNAGPGH